MAKPEAQTKPCAPSSLRYFEASRTDWELKLHLALWAYHVAYKTSTCTTPFNMVYGLDAILQWNFCYQPCE